MALAELLEGLPGRRPPPGPLPLALTELEIACGRALDLDEPAGALPAGSRVSPFDALQQAVLPSLHRAPCLVSFSGGVDSSLVLAAAVAAARTHGLALPIPVTLRYPDVAEAEESGWQERVVAHLGLGDWSRVSVAAGELDYLGPVAARHLLRHGVLWPPNLHSQVPVLERAGGGSVLTGYGGDHILSRWPLRPVADRLRGDGGRAVPALGDPLRLALAGAPGPLRYAWRRGRPAGAAGPWLTDPARRAVEHAEASIYAGEPASWGRWLAWRLARRSLALARRDCALLARDRGAAIGHPLLDPGFVGALAREGGALGLGDRARIARRIAGEALPASVTGRRTKASFEGAFWGEHTRRFVAAWDGRGINGDLVRGDLLNSLLRSGDSRFGLAMVLQAAWLDARGRESGRGAPSGQASVDGGERGSHG